MACDMCGKEGYLQNTEVEGTILKVCKSCAKYGKRVQTQYKKKKFHKKQKEEEPKFIEQFIKGYGNKIKHARELKELKQEILAQKLAVKESLLHSIESEHIKPNIELAKKLESFLNIKILEKIELEEEKIETRKESRRSLTIGDLLKKAMNKE